MEIIQDVGETYVRKNMVICTTCINLIISWLTDKAIHKVAPCYFQEHINHSEAGRYMLYALMPSGC